jgi:hypothetical protein
MNVLSLVVVRMQVVGWDISGRWLLVVGNRENT